jgi:spermidine synthase
MRNSQRNRPRGSPERVRDPAPGAPGPHPGLVRLQFCLFLSGAAGLIYQVGWTKLLGQLFGSSAYAIAAVLAVFMGGMAAGSALFARWRPQANGIALYASLEFLIALSALASLPGIPLVRQVYLAVYPHFEGPLAPLLLRLLGSAVVLGLPAVLMGGTFPVLLGSVARGAVGLRASRFYSVNTAGAVAGTLAAGFALLPLFGLRFTILVAAAANVAAGIAAWRMARQRVLAAETLRRGPDVPVPGSALYLVCFAWVGATAMACELGWTRLLATLLLSSTYAFSLMLAVFLLGMAIGSALFEAWFRRKAVPSAGTFAATQLATAAAVLFSLLLYREIPDLLLALLRAFGRNFSGLVAAEAAVSSLALLPAAMCFGFNYPAVLALVSGSARSHAPDPARKVGQAMAANTAGAIAGALLAGFVLLPRAGSFRLVALSGAANLALGLLLFLKAERRAWRPIAVAAALLAALFAAGSSAFFRETSAAFSVVLYGGNHSPRLTAREMADAEDVVFFRDGIQATIAVTRSENYIALKTNGKVDASNLDSGTQLLLGDLGAVFHPNPRRVLIIGFGGGMTASAVSRFPEVERIDCVEIEPAVLSAASQLERLHRGVLRDPRLRIHVDDARNFLAVSRERYDLIISEPSNPWIAGIASLYTREFFEVVRAHLAPGGSFVQWVQAYGLSVGDFSMVLRSLGIFPDLTLWHSPGRDFLLLARDSTAPLSFDRSRALWARPLLRQDFETLHLTRPEGWPAYFRLDAAEIREFASRGPVNTDDHTRLEYSAPRHLLNEALMQRLEEAIDAVQARPLPALAGQETGPALLAAAETALEVGPKRAARFLDLIHDPVPRIEVLRARSDLANKRLREALERLERASLEPNHYDRSYWLAVAQERSGQRIVAEATLDALLAREPTHAKALASKVELASARGDWASAISTQTNVVALAPEVASAWCRLGDLYLRSSDLAAAEAPLKKGIERDPYAFLCHRDLGELFRASGRTAQAIDELQWVVRYFPEADPKTFASLALAFDAAGDHQQAEAALQKGKRIFPEDPLLRRFRLRSG